MSIPTAPNDRLLAPARVTPVNRRTTGDRASANPAPRNTAHTINHLFLIALLWAGAAIVAWLALQTLTGQQLDEWALEDAQRLGESDAATRLHALLMPGLDAVPAIGLIASIAAAVTAAVRLRRVAAGAVLLGSAAMSVVTVQVLKLVVLDKPDLGVQEVVSNSFPSGHASVIAIVGFVWVLAVPSGARGWTALAAAAATVWTGTATVLTSWHRPADVIAAILVCAGWSVLAALVLRFLSPATASSPKRSMVRFTVAAVLGTVALGLASILAIAQLWWQGPGLALAAGIGAIAAFALLAHALVGALANHRSAR